MRIITDAIKRAPTQALLNEAGIDTLKSRRECNMLLFFHKIIHNATPEYLQDLKPGSTSQNRHNFGDCMILYHQGHAYVNISFLLCQK